ncbi:uncharacterized protein [Dermacentor albipictus]|uniref:uncharacterized protein n=1 Tax=Dermacentor albipictus TaxID=60249 RepID=UPI0031FC2A68
MASSLQHAMMASPQRCTMLARPVYGQCFSPSGLSGPAGTISYVHHHALVTAADIAASSVHSGSSSQFESPTPAHCCGSRHSTFVPSCLRTYRPLWTPSTRPSSGHVRCSGAAVYRASTAEHATMAFSRRCTVHVRPVWAHKFLTHLLYKGSDSNSWAQCLRRETQSYYRRL